MNRQQFEFNIEHATNVTCSFARQQSYSYIPANCRYIIKSNLVESESLNQTPLSRVLKVDNKTLTKDEVVDLLFRDTKLPQWIDMSVYSASKRVTIIELLVSENWVTDERLYSSSIMPFRTKFALPNHSRYFDKNKKVDINWRLKMDRLAKFLTLLNYFRSLFYSNKYK